MDNRISRIETLEFIKYLRTKEHVLIESQILHQRTFFNSYKLDMGVRARTLLKKIKLARSATEAYRIIAHETAKQNSLWKTFPEGGYMFEEDFMEYVSENKEAEKDPVIQKWHANGYLESRQIFINYFPTEYMNFSRRLSCPDEENFMVISNSIEGTYNYYRTVRKVISDTNKEKDITIPRRMSVGFDGATCGLDMKKLVSLAKLICADCDIDCINIADYSQNEVISVYRCTDVRPEEEKPESN